MPNKAILTIEFTDYWCSGSGSSGPGDADSSALRGADRLPYVPAKQYHGLLREAAEVLAPDGSAGWCADKVELVFGGRVDGVPNEQGCIDCRNARLPSPIIAAVRAQPKLAETLFTRLTSTAIDHETGAALSETLRTVEVAAPLTLTAELTWAPEERLAADPGAEELAAEVEKHWVAMLDAAAALVLAVGGNRSDGLGRAILTVTPATSVGGGR